MRSLLLNINPDPGHAARLATAIALAKGRGGHVTCLQTLVAPLAIGHPESALTVPEMTAAMERAARAFRDEIESELDAAGLEWTWLQLYGDPATIIVRHARLADVVILSSRGSYPTVGSVTLHARTPVLATPGMDREFWPGSPALIAWNGSEPCANALRASLPLIRDADMVHILVVDDDSETFPAAHARDYLLHHDIASEIHCRQSDGEPVTEVILTFARQLEAGLVVAGAFGHNRLREMLLGSITRALLEDSPLPLLLAH
jgi:nucleotide-binding universal stress UspA family protein